MSIVKLTKLNFLQKRSCTFFSCDAWFQRYSQPSWKDGGQHRFFKNISLLVQIRAKYTSIVKETRLNSLQKKVLYIFFVRRMVSALQHVCFRLIPPTAQIDRNSVMHVYRLSSVLENCKLRGKYFQQQAVLW